MSKTDFNLYLIADVEQVKKELVLSVKRAIDGGIRAVQLRGKNIPARELLKIGERLKQLTGKGSIKLFINDRIDIAMALDADGIHLGQKSIPVGLARKMSGNRFIIGVSTHSLKEAREAEDGGADFITFGPIFETQSKLVYGPPVGLTRLGRVTKEVNIPVFAIGGIRKERVRDIMENGAYGVAVISAIFGAKSVYSATVDMLESLKPLLI